MKIRRSIKCSCVAIALIVTLGGSNLDAALIFEDSFDSESYGLSAMGSGVLSQ